MNLLALTTLLATMIYAKNLDPDALREPGVRIVHRFGSGDELIAQRDPLDGANGAGREALRRRVKGVVKPLREPEPRAHTFAPFSEGCSRASDGAERWFVDLQGRRLKTDRLGEAGDFHEGMARAAAGDGTLWGYLNKAGRWAVPARYAVVSDYSHGRAIVATRTEADGPRFGAIDKAGREKIPFRFNQIGDFQSSPSGPVALAHRADVDEVGVLAFDGSFAPIPGATELAFYGSAHDKDLRVAGVKGAKGLWGFMLLGTAKPSYVEPPRWTRLMVPGIERGDGDFNVSAARTLARDADDRGWIIDLATGRPLTGKSCRDAALPYGGEEAGIACLGDDGAWEEIGFASGITRPMRPESLRSFERKSGGAGKSFKPWTRPGALGVWR